MVIPIAQQFHLVSAAEVSLTFLCFLFIKEKERKVSLNPPLGVIQFDFILSEEREGCGSSLCANVGHENK